ncbi:MAG TPA: hypothetical protein GX513_06945, partial [Firmicutes bacterium]|nr:hypothetical protein [Bacillota bacterium]
MVIQGAAVGWHFLRRWLQQGAVVAIAVLLLVPNLALPALMVLGVADVVFDYRRPRLPQPQ